MKEEAWAQDCVQATEKIDSRERLAERGELKQWRKELSAEVEKAVETAQREPAPVGSEEDWRAISSRDLVETIS